MEPVKCPDCETWWRGTEHRCGDYVKPIPAIPFVPYVNYPHCCVCANINSYSGCSHTGGPTYCSMHNGQWTWTSPNTTAPVITIGDPPGWSVSPGWSSGGTYTDTADTGKYQIYNNWRN